MSDDIKYPPELEAPIEPCQYRSEYAMQKFNAATMSYKPALNTDPSQQRKLALWVVEKLIDDEADECEITLYRSRPRAAKGAQTRLLGKRGPTGRIVGGGSKSVRARFDRRRLLSWAEAWLVAHGVDDDPAPADLEEQVIEYLSRYGLPTHLHKYMTEEVTGG